MKMITPDEALATILSHIQKLPVEKVYFTNALNRICAEDITSSVNIPYHNNSAMDGYAIVASDTASASKENPVTLEVIGEYQAGIITTPLELKAGQAIRIMTGAPIPPGADAVVEKEATTEEKNHVTIYRHVQKGDNIRLAGEDITQGECIVTKGTRITAAIVGLLASAGVLTVTVAQKPKVALIATGDEIAEPGTALAEGLVINSNAYTLMSLIREYGGIPHYLGIARDTMESSMYAIQQALSADIIISSGGISEGKYDFIIEALRSSGFRILVERIAMKPGKPCVFAQKGNILYFGLPGNPVSSMVSFIQFVRPAMLAMQGATKLQKPVLQAICKEPIKRKSDGRTHYIRGILTFDKGQPEVVITGPQGSGILRSMALANCLIILPPETLSVKTGDLVTVQLIHHPEV
ncbi:MAG: molybdopterin molybdotransferase MoeA [Spirochaetes bacterium]|nr:molybdopterin molybdotransferase MoeA [Spirochaetota bacterium]